MRLTISVYFIEFKGKLMNKDQVKGSVKEVAGKIQSKVGELVGDKGQQAEGLLKQAEGKTQKRVGAAKEVVKDAVDKL